MADGKEKAPFYEGRRFKGIVAVVGLVSAVIAVSGIPKLSEIVEDLSSASVAVSNTEIVLDTSADMGGRFEAKLTRLDAAVNAIEQAGERDDEGLALRRTSPACSGEEDLLVDFGTGHKDAVLDAAREQRPGGTPNIVNAVVEALGDFRTEGKFSGPPSTRRVLVFTTGRDECFEGDVANKIGGALEEASVSASFTLIALNVSGKALEQLEELKEALRSADAHVETRTPDTTEELEGVVEEVKEASNEAIEEGKQEAKDEQTISG
jgi:hypothetical protein